LVVDHCGQFGPRAFGRNGMDFVDETGSSESEFYGWFSFFPVSAG
jgi:hypothetical protein